MKKLKLLKKGLTLFLVLFLCIENFAAVVSDNDGSAFITKAEFDSLKNSFQSQIDQYNTSIDAKIDGAIAAYLAGIKVSSSEKTNLDAKANYRFPLVLFYNNNSWNTVSSDYYTLSRPRARVPSYSMTVMPHTTSADVANLSIVDDNSYRQYNTLVSPVTANRLIVCAFIEQVYDTPPMSGETNYVKSTDQSRSLGGSNFRIFDLLNEGRGYQYIDYKVTTGVSVTPNGGHYSVKTTDVGKDNAYIYNQCLGAGASSSGTPTPAQIKANPQNYQFDWVSNSGWRTLGPAMDNRSGDVTTSAYASYTETNLGVKKKWNVLMGEWEGSTLWTNYTTIRPGDVDSSNFVWQTNGRKYLFAGDSFLPAQKDACFAFTPDWSKGANTEIELIDYVQPDFHRAVWINNMSDGADRWVARWSVKRTLWCPPFTSKYYSGLTSASEGVFSGLPATCIRWYDEEGLEHYLDEGMFLKTFANLSGEAEVSFEVTFGTNSSATENVNFYVSKKPFNRVNAKSQLYPFKVDREASEVTSKTLETGKKYKITVDDIKKNDQLYILWEPTDGYNKMVQLDSFENFLLTKK